MSTVSEKLDRIKNAVDRIRTKVGASDTTSIEDVVSSVENMGSVEDCFETKLIKTDFRVFIKKTPIFDCSELTSLDSMFMYFGANEISLINTARIKTLRYAFTFSKVKKAPKIESSIFTSLQVAFSECTELEDLPELDCSSVVNSSDAFYKNQNLVNVGGLKNIGKAYNTTMGENYSSYSINFSYSTNLTHDSLMNIINGLYDIKSKGCKNQQLSLGTKNLAKLTDEEKQIAIDKGWNLS